LPYQLFDSFKESLCPTLRSTQIAWRKYCTSIGQHTPHFRFSPVLQRINVRTEIVGSAGRQKGFGSQPEIEQIAPGCRPDFRSGHYASTRHSRLMLGNGDGKRPARQTGGDVWRRLPLGDAKPVCLESHLKTRGGSQRINRRPY
jgi:hypothetical protein